MGAIGLTTLACTFAAGQSAPDDVRGLYFTKKSYTPSPLPAFAALRSELPAPIFEENPAYVALYWKAWEIAFRNFHQPAPNSHFVSSFIDAAFNQNIFLWDTCFMSMFCNVAHPLVPGIESLDNFYARQHLDGEICREINRTTGEDYIPWVDSEHRSLFSRNGWLPPNDPGTSVIYRGRQPPPRPPFLTLEALDNPLPAWAELESFAVTGDRARVVEVYRPLVQYYNSFREYLRQGNGLFVTDWASMDNSPRNAFIARGGTAVDTSCQMVLFARELAQMAEILGDENAAKRFSGDANALTSSINRLMWDPQKRFYFDLDLDGHRSSIRTVAAYWALLARVASPEQAAALVADLTDPHAFGTPLKVATLASDDPGFDPAGGYWRGAVWAPTTMMVIRGLENYNYRSEARAIAMDNIKAMSGIFGKTGTIWENYASDGQHPGTPAKKDFVGWSGLGPIEWLLEFGVGLKPNASENKLVWELHSSQRVGCDRYRFNGHIISLSGGFSETGKTHYNLHIVSDGAFTLELKAEGRTNTLAVHSGDQTVEF